MTVARTHVALVHWPVRDREGRTITTAVTTLDVHDVARSACTYGLAGVWIVTPIAAQRAVVEALLEQWKEGGAGERRTPERTQALALVHVVPHIDSVVAALTEAHGLAPRIVATSARAADDGATGHASQRTTIAASAGATLLLFGTGHGLAEGLLARADACLPAIRGGHYNHLSVRAAVAITLDRLFG